jgi:hypothetical protein
MYFEPENLCVGNKCAVARRSCSFMKRSESGKTKDNKRFRTCVGSVSKMSRLVRLRVCDVAPMFVVELPTGSKRVGQGGLTQTEGRRRLTLALTVGWWARTVVVLAGRRCRQKRATWRSVSQVLVKKYSVEGVVLRHVLSHSEDGEVVLLPDEKPNLTSERAA